MDRAGREVRNLHPSPQARRWGDRRRDGGAPRGVTPTLARGVGGRFSLRGLLPGPDGAELVVWAIAGNADTDVLRLDVAIVDALAPGEGVVWVTERDVQGKLRALTAIEHAWRGGETLQKIVQLVGTDAAMFAGKDDEAAALLAVSIRDSYAARFEGEHHPKALIIESLRAGRPTRVAKRGI